MPEKGACVDTYCISGTEIQKALITVTVQTVTLSTMFDLKPFSQHGDCL